MNRKIVCAGLLVALSACASPPAPSGMKIGKPYSIGGERYYPEYDPGYDKIGTASWYGPGFHGKSTATGEIYDQNELTAAHPTLPMPSLVRVTNLSNGKSIILRINDRGPFKSNRIIDLSKRAAERIGVRSTAEVRVQFLKPETDQYIAMRSSGQSVSMEAYNDGSLTPPAANQPEAQIVEASASPSEAAQPDGQIVEASVSSASAGQVVTDAAPVMTVSAENIGNSPAPPPLPLSQDAPPRSHISLMKQAWADENVPYPTAPASQPPNPVVASAPPEEAPPPFATAPTPPPAPVVVSSNSAVNAGSYYIQAGSFAAQDNAHSLSSRLAPIAAVSVGKVEAGGKTWWRVRLGPFLGSDEADEALIKVRESGVADARVIHL